ncbi:MAG: hypothetical protein ABSD21_07850 [Rhizomicrobium sp.]|jgi:hypothetical protein
MKKIPLGSTLVGAYRFLVTNIVSIVGTVWFPIVFFSALCAGLVYLAVPHDWLSGNLAHLKHLKSPVEIIALLLPILRVYPAILFLILLMTAMVFTGLMRHALGQKTTTTFIYFSLGAQVWRMLGAFVLYYLIVLLLAGVLALLFCAVYYFGVPLVPHGPGIAILVVLGVIEVLFYIYATVRLAFFLPAVVVAENKIGIGSSWSLGGGNFWRIIVVVLLAVIPLAFVAQLILQMTVMPVIMVEAMKLPHDMGPEDIGHFLHALLPLLPVFIAIVLVERIAILGLLCGAIGTAYNAVTASDAPAEGATSAAA